MSNKKKGKIVKEEKDNKQEEEILKLEIENSEEIDEKEFEKAKRKYEERMKLPFGVKKGIYVKILKEGVYIIGDSDTKDIFEGIFKN